MLTLNNFTSIKNLLSFKKDYDINDDSFYLYSCAQLKAREIEFLDKAKIERMVNARTIEDLRKIILETHYANLLNLLGKKENFDKVIVNFNIEAVRFLNENLKNEHVSAIDLLMLEESIHNYKVIIKALLLKENLSYLFIPFYYSYETLLNEFFNENESFQIVDSYTKKILNKIKEILLVFLREEQKNQNLSLSDLKDFYKDLQIQSLNKGFISYLELEFEKFFIENLFILIKSFKSKLIEDYFRHLIDIGNIKSFVRINYLNLNINIDDVLINFGFIPLSYFKKLQVSKSKGEDVYEVLVKDFLGTVYQKIIEHGVKNLLARQSFFSFDKNEYLFYLNFFDNVKYSIANIEKIFSFFLRKKIELKVLNMIFLGTLYSIEKSKLSHKAEILNEV